MEIDLQPYAYFEGEIVPADQARVSIATHALQYGTGAFGGIRGYLDVSGETINIFRLPDHTRRLMNSARILRSELALQRRFRKLGITTRGEYVRNVLVRGTYRLVPEPVRRAAYRALLANRTGRRGGASGAAEPGR